MLLVVGGGWVLQCRILIAELSKIDDAGFGVGGASGCLARSL